MSFIPLGVLAASGAGGAAPAFESIATAAGSGSSVTLSSIPSTYSHLQIRGVNYFTGSDYRWLGIRMNGDTGNNYSAHWMLGDSNSNVYANGTASYDNVRYWNSLVPSSDYGIAFIIDILDYASTSKYKTVKIFAGQNDNNADNAGLVYLGSGLWQSTAAISSLTFLNSTGSFSPTGTTWGLYGIKG